MTTPTGAPTRRISLQVNGETVVRDVECRSHLVDFLRDDCGLKGSHLGCEHGVCGACTVRLDGQIVRGCQNRRKTVSASIEPIPATTSTSAGPW